MNQHDKITHLRACVKAQAEPNYIFIPGDLVRRSPDFRVSRHRDGLMVFGRYVERIVPRNFPPDDPDDWSTAAMAAEYDCIVATWWDGKNCVVSFLENSAFLDPSPDEEPI